MVILSDGMPVEVKTLGLYEIDLLVPANDPGPYLYGYKLDLGSDNPRIQEIAYTLADFPEPPAKPAEPECDSNRGEWDSWRLFRAILTHETKRLELAAERANQVAQYILDNCVEDKSRVKTPEDLDKVLLAAIPVEVTLEDIEAVLASVFPGDLERFAAYASYVLSAEGQSQLDSHETVGNPEPGNL